jgi:hypothetical protein
MMHDTVSLEYRNWNKHDYNVTTIISFIFETEKRTLVIIMVPH